MSRTYLRRHAWLYRVPKLFGLPLTLNKAINRGTPEQKSCHSFRRHVQIPSLVKAGRETMTSFILHRARVHDHFCLGSCICTRRGKFSELGKPDPRTGCSSSQVDSCCLKINTPGGFPPSPVCLHPQGVHLPKVSSCPQPSLGALPRVTEGLSLNTHSFVYLL